MFAVEGSGWVVARIGFPYNRKVGAEELEFVHRGNLHGYLMCTFTPWQLGNLFIGGPYTHVELMIGSGKAIGGLTSGVTERKIIDILPKVGRYCILRPKFATDAERQLAVDRAIELKNRGLEYDFGFDRDNDQIYCSEVPQEGYIEHLKGRYGGIIRPTEFYNDLEFWEVVFSVDVVPRVDYGPWNTDTK